MAGKPTPTQAENDAAAMGEHVMDKEPDGSPEDEGQAVGGTLAKKQAEAKKPTAAYQTRAATPAAKRE
jgi:hypothetical protein